MQDKANEFWKKASPGLRQYRNLTPPTREQAEIELQEATGEALTEEQVQAIFSYAVTGKKPKRRRSSLLPEWLTGVDTKSLNQEMLVALARNADASDDEVDQLLEELRREVFKEDDRDDKDQA